MKIFLITDTHFGIYPIRNEKWLQMMTHWCYNFLIPTLQKYAKPGDVLLHLGDVYDNRTSINVKVLDKVIKIFEDIAKIIPTHILIGNHDNFNMADTDINSVSTLRNIPNIFTYTEPTIHKFGNADCLLLPWIHGKHSEKEILEKYNTKAKILFCHSDLNGARTQVNPTRPNNRNICELTDFNGYDLIYSGHIHINQKIGNFTFIGAPYHMDRNDINNEKGIYVIDPDSSLEKFIPNTVSPIFNKIYIKTEQDLDNIDIDYVNKNYIDLLVNMSLIINNDKFRLKLDQLLSTCTFESIDYVDNQVESTLQDSIILEDIKVDDVSKDIKQISIEWVETRKYYDEDDTNDFTINGIKDIIQEAFNIRDRDIKLAKSQN